MASTDQQALQTSVPVPGDGLDTARMPGHWLLARLGKRVLRPGGVELTRWMLDALGVDPEDRVVELASGLGATARLTLARRPAAYTAVDRDAAAVAALSALAAPGPTKVRAIRSDAADTGLPDGDATIVYGEAMLTMQPYPAKRRVVREARRLLDDSTGRYAIHELCLLPDDLDPALADRITADLQDAIHVGARPLTPTGWTELLATEGFTVTARTTAPMALLEPRRMIDDEGLIPALRIVGRALRNPAALRRLLHMRRVFRRHSAHLVAISLLAVPTPTETPTEP
ncbi:methyltransferase domain-containing protein [Streptomyces sp. ID05-04B]|uniref:methyltransferase domain-containing protein n=1 Tax=unclassified Streptomyces TaxID=2593676 RepID=UPI000D1A2F00|nr:MULTISPECIES: methyltransferase domain-containing protein [unclassified Streptomyces]AVV46671.1 SAM-dependent methyltransferase [Streptomyces sp. P3]MDX5564274.1 methyltransferase domain-containing protein [Streptomyces sp. ID05-04B]